MGCARLQLLRQGNSTHSRDSTAADTDILATPSPINQRQVSCVKDMNRTFPFYLIFFLSFLLSRISDIGV